MIFCSHCDQLFLATVAAATNSTASVAFQAKISSKEGLTAVSLKHVLIIYECETVVFLKQFIGPIATDVFIFGMNN